MTAFLLGVAPSNDAESDGKWITFNGHKIEQYYYDTSNDSVSDLPWYEELLFGTVTGGVGGGASKVIKKGFDDVVTSAGKYFAKSTGKGNLDNVRKKGEPYSNHKVDKSGKDLPAKGEPNTSVDKLNPDGTVKQRRYYGPDGRAVEDIDYNHSNGDGTHTFPHRHIWDWNITPPRQK